MGMDARQHIIAEGIAEQRQIFGMENPGAQWILSGWDTWELNPYYHGPNQRHPEDYVSEEEEEWMAFFNLQEQADKARWEMLAGVGKFFKLDPEDDGQGEENDNYRFAGGFFED